MRKHTKVLAIVLGALLLVSLTVGGVMVMAADPTPTPSATPSATTTPATQHDAFLAALAAKLNIPVDQLETAISEAAQETATQAMKDRLQALVTAGKLTQEQADAYLEWLQSRPDVPGLGLPGIQGQGKAFGRGMMGGGIMGGGGMMGPRGFANGPCFQQPAATPTPTGTAT